MSNDGFFPNSPSEINNCGFFIHSANAVPEWFNRLVWHVAVDVAAAARRTAFTTC